jgi:CRISPR-associated protein Csm4
MKDYNEFTVEISLKSSVITPFQADTIFGHVCWAMRFLYGESSGRLEEFLRSYETETFPPLILTNGFPKGLLPRPILPPVHSEDLDKIVGRRNRVEVSTKIREVTDLEFIPKEILSQLSHKGCLDPKGLFELLFDRYESILPYLNLSEPMVVQHNAINRIKQETTALYFQEEQFFAEDRRKFQVYLKSSYFSKDELANIFELIGDQGYGKDKSTGKGHFDVEIKENLDLPEFKDSNAFMTLSSYVPNSQDPTNGCYKPLHKYGKLGGTYAKGLLDGNPFKKPILMFAAGSTFYDAYFSERKVYGSLLCDVHHDSRIKHYGYAFPLGIRLDEEIK